LENISARYKEWIILRQKKQQKNGGISQRRVQLLCEQGRVAGAVRLGWAWAIPKEADKPADARRKDKGKI